ncbi:STAS domain-containing protein [Catenovulum adriaticum]|uniref:STAS domain-containing protein n=1 Tax=Catenovulum adriaticum TaxID=2984846 RepID=A0ABY7AN18_9ALTE|nr:STAS domain-containing protein [Catenovulum sp. TS8]WAJ70536.1 STAS domain-containing protein [Catenovulum sp. TS8]
MIKLAEKQNNHHFWQLAGELTRFADLSHFPDLPCPDQKDVDVCLTDVSKVDTAGLAYLIKLQAQLAEKNINIRYFDASDNLKKLANLYGVSELLGMK